MTEIVDGLIGALIDSHQSSLKLGGCGQDSKPAGGNLPTMLRGNRVPRLLPHRESFS